MTTMLLLGHFKGDFVVSVEGDLALGGNCLTEVFVLGGSCPGRYSNQRGRVEEPVYTRGRDFNT